MTAKLGEDLEKKILEKIPLGERWFYKLYVSSDFPFLYLQIFDFIALSFVKQNLLEPESLVDLKFSVENITK